MFLKLLLLSGFLLLIALAGLAVRILLKPKGEFPDTHVGHNKEMRKRGIACAQQTDIGCKPVSNSEVCMTCSSLYQQKPSE
jgi:hypothetical protein